RILHSGLPHDADLLPARVLQSYGRPDSRSDLGKSLSLHRLPEHRRRRVGGRPLAGNGAAALSDGEGARASAGAATSRRLLRAGSAPSQSIGKPNAAPPTQASPPSD